MKKFKRIIINAISFVIAMLLLISPLDVLAGTANTTNIIESSNKYVDGDSVFYLSHADVQVDDENYYPETASRFEEDKYNQSIDYEYQSSMSKSSDSIPGDPMVYYTQKWLNQEYGNVSGFGSVEENGKTGWNVIYGLLRALQHELGITSLSDNFGNQTSTLYSKNLLSRTDGKTDNKYAILQCALWCKGYNPGYNFTYDSSTGRVSINSVFDAQVENAVIELKKDAGLTNPNGIVTLNLMKALMSMNSFKLLGSSYGAKAEVRNMQQELNRKYEDYIGLIPCDGVYARDTNRALIYAFQAEEGLPVGTANGNFGVTTKKCAPNIPYNKNNSAALSYQGNYYTDTKIATFTKFLQFALYVNGFGDGDFSGNLDSTTKENIKNFQSFYALTKTGTVNIDTWMSLFLSSGNPNRAAIGADCATILTKAKAETLFNNGYRYIGRYLTGTYAGGLSKALTIEEEQTILDAGLRFFPIYQDGGTKLSYFTSSQGTKDGQAAKEAALKLGIPSGTIIYFAVDFDALDYQITSNIIPYFKAVNDELQTGIYRTGIYGPRNVCSRVSKAGYSCSSFVGDMSTGFSGNLGYKIPDDWAFSQFANLEGNNALGNGDGRIEIDKDAVSGKNQCVSRIDKSVINTKYENLETGNNYERTIDAGKVSILGNYFNIFKFNIGFNLPQDGIKFESCYDENHKEIKYLIDVRVNGESATVSGDRQKVGKFNQAFDKVKKTYYSFSNTEEFTKNYKGLKGSLTDHAGKFGFDSNINIFGFMVVNSDDGAIKESGVCITSSVSGSISYPLTTYPIFYLKCQVVGSINGTLTLEPLESNQVQLKGKTNFSVQPKLGAEVNLLVANAYAGVSGKIDCALKFPVKDFSESFSAKYTASVFLEYNALMWGNKYEWAFHEKVLYPETDEANYTCLSSIDDLKFIEPISKSNNRVYQNTPDLYKSDMQIYCKPQIINLGNNTLMMLYIDDSQTRSKENRTILMYNIFNNGSWGTPKPVNDDGTADFEPIVCSDNNGGAYIIWQNANKVFDSNVTIDEMSKNIDLNFVHWNGSDFDNFEQITTDNNHLEMMYRIAATDTDVSVVWVENSENDTFGINGQNSIHRRTLENNTWKNEEIIADGLNIISSIDTSYNNTENVIAYSTKTGTDTSTINDLELFYYNDGKIIQLTNDLTPDYSVSLFNNELYWISNNSLSVVTNGDLETKKVVVPLMDATVSKINVVSNSNGNKSVLWSQTFSDDSDAFYCVNYNESQGSYGNVEPLCNDVGQIRNWDATMLSNGKIETVYGLLQEDNSINIMQKQMNEFCNISVNPTIYYEGQISSGNEINFVAELTNNGSIDLTNLVATIYDENQNVVSTQTIETNLPSGNSSEIKIPFKLPSTITRSKYTVEILPENENDTLIDDNSGTITIGLADIAISDITETRSNSGRTITALISNSGFDTAKSISVEFRKDGITGEVLDKKTIDELKSGDSEEVTFNVSNDLLDSNISESIRSFFLTVSSSDDESDYENNNRIVNVYPDYNVNLSTDGHGTVKGSGTFEYNSNATITAVPDDGYVFYAWYEDGNILYGTPSEYEITVDKNRDLKAIFTIDPEKPTTVNGSLKQLAYRDGKTGGVAPGLTVMLGDEKTTSDENGNFSFTNILPGSYILTITGSSTFDRSILVEIDETNKNLGDVIIACFDFVKDGVIDDKDLDAWSTWLNEGKGSEKYNPFADLTNDGFINGKDFAMLLREFNNKTSDDINKIIEEAENRNEQ